MLNFIWRRLQQEEQGFTLVELLVVIAILGVLAGIGIPTYRGFIQRSYKSGYTCGTASNQYGGEILFR